jgi:hypothetical protein
MNVSWFGFECRQSRALARWAAAGCLEPADREALARHTGHCADCRYYAAELSGLGQLMGAWEAATPRAEVTSELSAQWHRAILEAARPDVESSRASAPVVARSSWFGLDRALPVSLLILWLVAIVVHLNTPPIRPVAESFRPALKEIRQVVEWLMRERVAT